jgi:hypothetical protein
MRKAQRIWNELVAPNMVTDCGLSCPKFFYMSDEDFDKFMKGD